MLSRNLKKQYTVVVESNLAPKRDAAPTPNLIFNFKALYENDAAPSNLITIAYFRSFFLVITSIMVTNFRNYEPL
jgi:hypothetical protein